MAASKPAHAIPLPCRSLAGKQRKKKYANNKTHNNHFPIMIDNMSSPGKDSTTNKGLQRTATAFYNQIPDDRKTKRSANGSYYIVGFSSKEENKAWSGL